MQAMPRSNPRSPLRDHSEPPDMPRLLYRDRSHAVLRPVRQTQSGVPYQTDQARKLVLSLPQSPTLDVYRVTTYRGRLVWQRAFCLLPKAEHYAPFEQLNKFVQTLREDQPFAELPANLYVVDKRVPDTGIEIRWQSVMAGALTSQSKWQ